MSLDSNLQSAFIAVGNAVKGKISASEKGANNGIATLDSNGKVPAVQLPSFVDDVLEYASLGNFPTIGATGIIYIAIDTNRQYRWSGSAYAVITSGGAVDSVAGKTGVVTLETTDIVGLDSALSGKASISHTHAISDITGLQTALDAKATTTAIGATDTDYVAVFSASLL